MFKPAFQLMGLLMIALLSTASMCNKADDAAPPSPSLIGKWKLTHTSIEAIKVNGDPFYFLDSLINGSPVYWEFSDNGIMKATEGSVAVESNWELKVERPTPDGLGIDKGTLKLTGSYADQVKSALQLDALVYSIERTGGPNNIMTLSVEPNNLSSIYSAVTITYFYVTMVRKEIGYPI